MQNIINQTKRGKFNRCLWVTVLTWASIAIPRLSLWSHAKKIMTMKKNRCLYKKGCLILTLDIFMVNIQPYLCPENFKVI